MSTVFSKMFDNVRDRYEFAQTHIKRETVILYFALANIMIIALLLRFKPAVQYDWVINANDPFSQLIAARYIDTRIGEVGIIQALLDYVTFVDPSMWYPNPGNRVFGQTQYIGTPMTAVLVRQILLLVGINIPIEEAAYLAPGILGTMTVLMVYFLGKELSSKRVGLFSAFILALSPGHLQRSITGFFDNEALGIFLMLLTFYLFLKALRTGSLTVSMLSGISLGFLLVSWGAATFAIQLISLYAVVLVLVKKFSDRLLTAFSLTIIIAFTIAVNLPRVGPSLLFDIDGLLPLGVVGILVLFSLYQNYKEKINSFPFLTGRNLELTGYGIIGIGVAFIIFNFFVPIIPSFRSKFITVLIPFFRDNTPILKSVAEHLIVTWASLFRNLFVLVFLIPIGVLYLYRKPTERNIFLLVYVMTTLYFSGSMVRLILILAPAAAITGAKAIEETLLPYAMVLQEKFFLSKRKRAVSRSIGNEHVSIAFIVIFVVLFMNLIQGITISQQILGPSSVEMAFPNPSSPGGVAVYGDWFETFDWIKRETATSSVIASWWDYGYWETLANRTTVVDNATLNSTQIGNIGAMLMSTPDVALQIASYYDIDYIIVLVSAGQQGLDNDLGKVQWMIKIGEASGSIDKALGHPINQTDYFKYADNGAVVGYDNKFFTSLIWAIMTSYPEGDSTGDQIKQAFSQNSVIKDNLPKYDYGFAAQYKEVYSQIFKEAYFSSNNIVRVFQIDWDAAERLTGITH